MNRRAVIAVDRRFCSAVTASQFHLCALVRGGGALYLLCLVSADLDLLRSMEEPSVSSRVTVSLTVPSRLQVPLEVALPLQGPWIEVPLPLQGSPLEVPLPLQGPPLEVPLPLQGSWIEVPLSLQGPWIQVQVQRTREVALQV